MPTWDHTPPFSQTRGPPESPWQEDTPDAPAQIMASVILFRPQYCLHWAGLSRGRAVCCRKRGLEVWPVLPQPVVTQRVPEGMLVLEEARHTGDTREVICAGEDSLRRVMSLLKFWEL